MATAKEQAIKQANWGGGFRRRAIEKRMQNQPQPKKVEDKTEGEKALEKAGENIAEGKTIPQSWPKEDDFAESPGEIMTKYRVRLGEEVGRVAFIIHPDDITKEEVAKIKKYLSFLESLNG